MTELFGAILIGGKSSRMGGPKALLPMEGVSLGAYLAELLAKVTGHAPVLVGQGDIGPGTEYFTRVQDIETGGGPLAGILGLFKHFPERDFLILAVDMPGMRAAALNWLMDYYRATSSPVIRPRFSDRPFGEPLAAIYRQTSHSLLSDAWGRGERGLYNAAPITACFEPIIPLELCRAFTNVNTVEEWRAFRDAQR